MNLSNKLLLCIVGVLGNAGIWGDASIDTVTTYTYSNNKITDSRNCARQCKYGQNPKRCIFDFTIRESYLGNRTYLTINDQVPGPPIQVCLNDIVLVNVVNKLYGGEVALHWRGITQRGSPFMDGVPMVTQCPISGGTTFTYAFRADEVGTHFYHAHSENQQLNGLYGSLIVKQPLPLESATSLYDYDRNEDVFMISTRTPSFSSTEAIELLINGDGSDNRRRIHVAENLKYRMRFINSIPLDCPLMIKIHDHPLLVIASDGRAVKPMLADSFILYPGERIDFVLSSNQRPYVYDLHIKGLAYCKNLYQKAHIIYENSNSSKVESNEDSDAQIDFDIPIIGQKLQSLVPPPAHLTLSPIYEKTVYLKIDANTIDINDNDNEYRYLSDALPVPVFYPARLSLNNGITKVIQINDKSFMYPNSPSLTQRNDIIKRTICNVGFEFKSKYFECVMILDVEYKSTLELVMVDEGFGDDNDKTFHLHGNPMYVLMTSQSYKSPITIEDVKKMDADGIIERNLLNPPQKDTIMIPNKGFVVVRVVADNPGSWLLECRSCGISSLPTAIIIQVNSKLPEKLVKNLPKCGNFKRPDTLLH